VSPRHDGAGRHHDRAWLGVSLLIVVTPVVVATVRALARGWLPMGDAALLTVRSRDVFTRHHPLLGSWSSSSLVTGETVNNPGSLYHDLTALPIKVLGPWVGIAMGVMLVNVAMVTLAVVVARRTGGVRAMVAVTLAIALLEFSMGSELLFDVWQPNATVLVFFAFLVSVWGLTTGDAALAPVVLGLSSLLIQTHLSYVYLVVLLTVMGMLVGGWVMWRQGRRVPRGPLVASGVIVAVAWIQPLIDQFAGEGNLSGLIRAAGRGGDATGIQLGTRLAGEALVLSGWWTRDSYSNAVPLSNVVGNGANVPVAGTVSTTLALVLVVGVLGGVALVRRSAATIRLMAAVAAVAVIGCWLSAIVMPIGAIGLSPHQARWMWPTAAFATAAVVFAITPLISRTWRAAGLVMAVAALVAVANLPTHAAATGPTADRRYQASAINLLDQLGVLEGRGTVLFDTSTLVFAEPYSGPIFAELQDRGIEFVVDRAGDTRQLGESRRFHPERVDADLRVWAAMGGPSREDDPRVEVVATVRPLDAGELGELEDLERAVSRHVRTHGLELSDAGRRAVRAGRIRFAEAELNEQDDPFRAISTDLAVEEGWLKLDPSVSEMFERYAELSLQRARGTVTVYAALLDFEP
jgi:hypothetical protein